MKFIKSKKLFEAIENFGTTENPGDKYVDSTAEPIPQAVMPISYVAAVEQVTRWREEANKAIEARRKEALKVVEADTEDRFKHMDAKEEKFNKGEKTSLDESLHKYLKEEVVKVTDKNDKFLLKLALINFHDWQQLAIDLIDSMDEETLQKFINDYNYEVYIPDVEFEVETPVQESLNEAEEDNEEKNTEETETEIVDDKIPSESISENDKNILFTSENIQEFTPWQGAVVTWEKIKDAGKLDDFGAILVDALYPEGISEQTLNDLLWFDANFVLTELGIPQEEE